MEAKNVLQASGAGVNKKVPLFQGLEEQLDMEELEASEIESLCLNCYKNVSMIS